MQTIEPWTVERVIAELAQLPDNEQRAPLEALAGDAEALRTALRSAIGRLSGRARLNAAILP